MLYATVCYTDALKSAIYNTFLVLKQTYKKNNLNNSQHCFLNICQKVKSLPLTFFLRNNVKAQKGFSILQFNSLLFRIIHFSKRQKNILVDGRWHYRTMERSTLLLLTFIYTDQNGITSTSNKIISCHKN